mmetsp:Transcript_10932/g.17184  ORF Transcript_10932/g.17184 Transcript_10932/m.17184 type:complete len:159 (-) Transcript_10932:131-607(-)|eukprot:CAMPEP_0184309422 /NCGR_PEP_ID=MMETSP1049-20130417/17592_1 /TAXON_ID=77928 /ORGANISM="Proteomonas sulcata, Strain CCMP704" /LENGTH=158 /DNA_ID=CAMNT_0026622305 /DNA_START=306 /DNA_END=782 /DNA_ORIENTATION=+
MGDMQRAKERLEAEAKMDLSSELHAARAAFFESLDTNAEVEEKKFTYAWCLIHQHSKDDMRSGISLLMDLASEKSVQKEALYYLATAQFRLEQYMDSRNTLKQLLADDPDNRQALDLKALVEHVLKREGTVGLAVFSGAVAATGAAALAVGMALLKKH